MIFCLRTFGCKTNQYESEAIREELLADGHLESDDPATATVMIINTCTVTGRADASWRNCIAHALRINPEIRIAVTGCAVNVHAKLRSDPRIEAFFPNEKKGEIARFFADGFDTGAAVSKTPASAVTNTAAGEQTYPGDNFSLNIRSFSGHTRAFLKIQDGCDNSCAYCIIPRARGRGRSRPAKAILAEAAALAAAGYRELVLTGINIGAYHDGTSTLADLVRLLAATPGLWRLRLGSVEPQEVTDSLLAAMAENANVCPHLHLPLQSGADAVLKRMNRKYSLDEFMTTVTRVCATLDRPAISTDIIVGYPGESDTEAEETLATVRSVGFSRTHIFLFSPRADTPAAALRPLPASVIAARRQALDACCTAASAAYAAQFIGKEETVIWEITHPEGCGEGYGEHYLWIKVPAAAGEKRRERQRIRITAAEGATLLGEIIR